MEAYTIIYAQTLERLEHAVTNAIQEGWKPHGSVTRDVDSQRWAQPMTRSETLKS